MKMDTVIKENPDAPPRRGLTAHDTCDRCGAQALIHVGVGDHDLMLCGHHGRAHEPALLAREGVRILTDDRPALDAEEGH